MITDAFYVRKIGKIVQSKLVHLNENKYENDFSGNERLNYVNQDATIKDNYLVWSSFDCYSEW